MPFPLRSSGSTGRSVRRHPAPVGPVAGNGFAATVKRRLGGSVHPLVHFAMAVGESEIAIHVVIRRRPVLPLRQGEADGEGGIVLALAIFFHKRPDLRRAERGEAGGFAVSLIRLVAPVRL